MKLKIEKPFCDKFTGENYIAGDVKEFDAARGKKLLADERKLVSEVKEEAKRTTKPKKVDE